MNNHYKTAAITALGLWISASNLACKSGPDYQRPDLAYRNEFKSASTQPADAPLRGDWWILFNDPQLTSLEETAILSNTDLQAAMHRVEQARARVDIAGSDFYPVITADPKFTRSRSSNSSSNSNNTNNNKAKTRNQVQVPIDLNYEVDLWGKIRRAYEAADAQSNASVIDLAVVHQTVTGDVAINYFTLRALDLQTSLIDENIALYTKQLALMQSQRDAGLVTKNDLLQASVQLDTAIAQSQDIRRQRADTEHAIAILIGKAPSELTIPKADWQANPPAIPAGLPMDLLSQRPDVAEAEQNLIAANAQVGVATANFYPSIQLTASAGWESVSVRDTFDWQNRFWSLAPSMTIPIFEGKRLTSQLKQAKARYEELVAMYRGTVLNAFKDVEDALTDLHYQSDQATTINRAVANARESARLSDVQYRQGLVAYLQVVDAERVLLTSELSSAQIQQQRMISTVLLIKSMGGGWGNQPTTRPTK